MRNKTSFISIWVCIIFGLVLSSCNRKSISSSPKNYDAFSHNDPFNIDFSELVLLNSNDQIKKPLLTEAELISVKELIYKAVAEYNQVPMMGELTGKYFVQLDSLEEINSEKLFFVNCLCKLEDEYLDVWEKELIINSDFGKCYFTLKINLTKLTHSKIVIS